MLLSIGMIVKNEERFLDSCLSALVPLLEAVDSELIIADTGSVDNTVEIAKKYTDNVFYFEWINDFAAARNSTLDKAKGEWFMFVDADEIFQNCDEIIRFFNSGEYKNYNAATFVQRSYTQTNADGSKTYGDFNAPRLSRIFPETRFEFAIHEGFNTFRTPIKILDAIADHYGYLHDENENFSKKKRDRNQPMLLKRLAEEKDPKALLYMQLFESFYESDPEKGIEYLNIGLKKSLEEKTCLIPSFYVKKAILEFDNNRYELAIKYLDEYMNITDKSIKDGVTGSDGEFTAFKAHILHCLGKYSEAVSEYIKYFRLFKDYCNGKLDTPDILMYELHYFAKDKFEQNHREFLICAIKAKKYNTALEYLKLFPAEKCGNDELIKERIRCEVIIAENSGFKNLKALCSQLSEKYKDYFFRYVRARIFLSENKLEYIDRVAEVSDRPELTELCGIIRDYFDNTISYEKIADYAEKYGMKNDPEILYICIAQNIDIAPLTSCSGFDASALSFSCCSDYEGFYKVLEEYDINSSSSEGCCALADVYKTAITRAEQEKRNATGLLTMYGRIGQRLSADENASVNVKGAVAAGNIISCFDARDFKGCIAHMRSLLQIFPDFKAVITEYQQVIKDAAGLGSSNNNSMASMAVVVKRNIRAMIGGGDTAGAENALNELAKLVPDDPEIAKIREEIEAAK